jgi:sodium/potassium-transporting ATPase subunit alpha
MNFHAAKAADLMKHFKTSHIHGLTAARTKDQLATLGPNILPPSNELPLWMKFITCFFSGFNPLLWIASIFVFLSWKPFGTPPSNVYNLALAIVLLIVIFLSSMFNFYQEVQTNQVLSTFTKLLPPACIVTRDAQVVQVSATELVPGDIVELTFGTRVPADCRVLRSVNLKIDKSLLNGENEPVRLFDSPVTDPEVVVLQSSNMAFMGCNVVEGTGTGLVVATGKDTQLAKIAREVSYSECFTQRRE